MSLFGLEEPSADPALPELKEWESAELLGYEKEMLGFYVTGHPLREHARPLELFTSFRLDRVPDDPARRREVWIGGLLGGLRVQNTKKGDLMARASLEDLGGSLDVVFFPKTYAKFSALLQADTPVLVKGNVGGEPERPGAPRRRDPAAGRRLEPAHQPDRRRGRLRRARGRAAARAAPRARPGARHASRSASSWLCRAGQSRSSIFRVIVCGCRSSW